MPRVFISVAEDSADVHAASLVRAAAALLPGVTFAGLTGPRLGALGVETVDDLSAHAAMLTGVIGLAGRAFRAIRRIEADWSSRRPDVLLLLDSPELHLRLAARARQRGIPVLYYIAPQTWASRSGRNRRIARDVDRLACILPFEEAYFRSAGVQAEYVGHPLFEQLARERPNPQRVAELRRAAPSSDLRTLADAPLVALLPGSRRQVIASMLPLQLAVIERLNDLRAAQRDAGSAERVAGATVRVAISAVDDRRAQQIREILGGWSHLAAARDAQMIVDDNASLLSAADLVLVASGTATLHVAAYRQPMIVMYDAGPLLGIGHRLAGRAIVNTAHLSLVNILAGRRIVPEFMPRVPDLGDLARVAAQLLADRAWRELMIRQIDEIVAPLERTHPSQRVCQLVAELLQGAPAAKTAPGTAATR